MSDLHNVRWGDQVAAVRDGVGPREGLVVDVSIDGRNIVVEGPGQQSRNPMFRPTRDFVVVRKAFGR